MLSRRRFFQTGLAASAFVLATGHTPYRQWRVYRQRYLLILTNKKEPQSLALGKQLVAILAKYLPSSQARLTRAPHDERIVSLISSGQLDLALLTQQQVRAAYRGAKPYQEYGPTELRLLITSADYCLVSRPDFAEQYAYLVTKTLIENRSQTAPVQIPAEQAGIPLHKGAVAYRDGVVLAPIKPSVPNDDAVHDHHQHQ